MWGGGGGTPKALRLDGKALVLAAAAAAAAAAAYGWNREAEDIEDNALP